MAEKKRRLGIFAFSCDLENVPSWNPSNRDAASEGICCQSNKYVLTSRWEFSQGTKQFETALCRILGTFALEEAVLAAIREKNKKAILDQLVAFQIDCFYGSSESILSNGHLGSGENHGRRIYRSSDTCWFLIYTYQLTRRFTTKFDTFSSFDDTPKVEHHHIMVIITIMNQWIKCRWSTSTQYLAILLRKWSGLSNLTNSL